MKKLLFVLATLCALFAFKGLSASADTDTFDVSSWKEMYADYKSSKADTVVLNVTNDIGPSGSTSGAEVKSGKSVIIKGNGNTLYFGDPNYPTTELSENIPARTHGFYSSSSRIGNDTVLRLENTTWVNSISNGIFELSTGAAATMQFNDVTEYNGSTWTAATPIMNHSGKIEFSGKNTFNITGSAQDFGSGKQNASSLGSSIRTTWSDQANWIQGGRDVTVVDGSTTLNMNGSSSNPFYHDVLYSSVDVSLKVADNAKMYWNIDNARFLEKSAVNSRTWMIGSGATFLINGTQNTTSTQWFDFNKSLFSSENKTPLAIGVADGGTFDATTGGPLNGPTKSSTRAGIIVGKKGTFSVSNLSTDSGVAISGSFSQNIRLSDASHFLVRSADAELFDSDSQIVLPDSGLAGKFSSTFDASSNVRTEPANHGSISTALNDFSQLSPGYNSWTRGLLTGVPEYFELYEAPTVLKFTGNLDRLYKLTSSDLPKNANETTGLISGQANMGFNINSNNPNPAVHVMLSMSKNNQNNIVSYFWQKKDGSVTPVTGVDQTIWTSDGQSTTSDDSGNNYNVDYQPNEGLLMKTTNALKAGNYEGATFDYTMVTGP
ncbi:pectate lyase-like adhesive domain-containing protein [Fructobacillus durionis]|uniref:Cell surface protein n=1 Tax=Fructobacillus durionis TaxID=283737 RepID=A0A1I1GS14_9LACO|nr:pectate lyase-like adhesive domain-containing protein [Fructobacillus durionis]SFC14276.1 hypothetical protein SAMN05660453_1163 [Fructobacillus durionis]